MTIFSKGIPVFNAKILEPAQALRPAAYDMGLLYFPMSFLYVRHKLVKQNKKEKQKSDDSSPSK